MNKKLTIVISFCFLSYSGVLFADNDLVSSQLENVMKTHVIATSKESESIDDVMKTIHPESPAAMHIKTGLEQIFPVFDLNVSLVEFSFVGLDNNYAMARVKQKMEKVSGPASFKSHVNEQLLVFKQEAREWKIWQAVMLDVEYL
ncbi:hypothetical protein MNBD_GAMMA16-2017 [hydrothermal vent metagenome]|uniref:DUF4440 domain-containing protein n=1 Tax=hydrothermal vent metagenome TaxID=652676 RepID=A0A3B0Z439_9ZZZZ